MLRLRMLLTVSVVAALAATMIWRAMTYFPQVIIGAITLLVWKRGQNKKAAAGAAT